MILTMKSVLLVLTHQIVRPTGADSSNQKWSCRTWTTDCLQCCSCSSSWIQPSYLVLALCFSSLSEDQEFHDTLVRLLETGSFTTAVLWKTWEGSICPLENMGGFHHLLPPFCLSRGSPLLITILSTLELLCFACTAPTPSVLSPLWKTGEGSITLYHLAVRGLLHICVCLLHICVCFYILLH